MRGTSFVSWGFLMSSSEVIGIVLGFVGLFLTIVSSAVCLAAWLATKITRLETKMEHAFMRLGALEKSKARNQPAAATARKKSR